MIQEEERALRGGSGEDGAAAVEDPELEASGWMGFLLHSPRFLWVDWWWGRVEILSTAELDHCEFLSVYDYR